MSCFREPSVAELLSEPIVRLVMARDGVTVSTPSATKTLTMDTHMKFQGLVIRRSATNRIAPSATATATQTALSLV